jgi:hypothetical protein
MAELSHAGGEAVGNLPERIRSSQLREQQSDELVPRIKALGAAFSSVFTHQALERVAIDQGKRLRKQARDLYHGGSSGWRPPWPRWLDDTTILNNRRFFVPFLFYRQIQFLVLDKSVAGQSLQRIYVNNGLPPPEAQGRKSSRAI